jgi:UrcA family protein
MMFVDQMDIRPLPEPVSQWLTRTFVPLIWRNQINAIIAKSIVAISLAAALTGYSVSAGAIASAVQVPTVTIRYDELDLAKPQGVEALYTRIEGAARRVCRADSSPHLRDMNRKDCHQDAVARAVKQIDLSTLTAVHRAKTNSTVG